MKKKTRSGFWERLSMPTALECPKCNSKLRQYIWFGMAAPQMYLCLKCGYRGPIGLQPEKIKKKK